MSRLFAGPSMIDDQFFYGAPWVIGLKRLSLTDPLTLTVLPLRRDAPVYIDDAVKAALPTEAQTAQVTSVSVTPQYRLNLNF
jgi:hypothetical protein